MSTVTEADAKAPSATCSLRSKRGKMWSSRGVGSRLPGSVKLKSQRKPSSGSPTCEQGWRGGVSRAQTCFGKRARRAFESLTPASSRHGSSSKPRAKLLRPSSPACHRSNSASAGISSAHRCYDCDHDRLVYLSCSGARSGTRQRCMALSWHSSAGGRSVRES